MEALYIASSESFFSLLPSAAVSSSASAHRYYHGKKKLSVKAIANVLMRLVLRRSSGRCRYSHVIYLTAFICILEQTAFAYILLQLLQFDTCVEISLFLAIIKLEIRPVGWSKGSVVGITPLK